MGTWMPDWGEMFVPSKPLLEIFLRGTVVYLCLFLLLRFVLKRQAGNVSITDLLLIVLIADAVQNAMAAEYRSVPEGLLLVATLVFWDYALDWLSYHIPALRKLVHPAPLLLIRNGKFLDRNLRRELLTEDELMSHLRKEGVDDPQQVKEAYLEGNGRISVIEKQDEEAAAPPTAEKASSDSVGKEVRDFLAAARVLHERLEQHQLQVESHQAKARELKDLLAGFGLRPASFTRSLSKEKGVPETKSFPSGHRKK